MFEKYIQTDIIAYSMKPESPPYVLAVGGGMGSGKTTLATELTKRLHARRHPATHIDIDDLARQHDPPLEGEDAYARLFTHLHNFHQRNETIVVSATFRDPSTRETISAISARLKLQFMGTFLHVPIEVARERAHRRCIDEPTHLLHNNLIDEKIADWHARFASHTHDDLHREPWHTFTDVLSTRELIIRTLQRIKVQ